jgi:predicted MFS family arabinose efflux permease
MTHSPVSLSPSPRHRWKVLAAGVAANAAFSVAFSGIPMTAVLMRTGYQLDNATLGLVLGLMGLGIAVSELPWGLLTDRWGDRPVLLTGLGSTAIALIAMALWAAPSARHIPGLGWLAAGLLLVGLLGGSVNGASGRAVMTWFDASERGLAMSIRQTAVPLGGGIGALVLPFVALHFGFAALYGLLALLCALSAVMSWAWVHEPPIARNAPSTSAATAEAPKTDPLRDARVWRIVLGIGILCAPQFAVLSFGTVFLHDFGHAGLATITATMVFTQVGAMVMRVWSGRWTDRRRNRPAYLRACSALSVALFAALAVLVMAAGTHTADSLALRITLVVLLGR